MAQFSDNEICAGCCARKVSTVCPLQQRSEVKLFLCVGFSVGLVRLDPAVAVDALRQRLSVMFR